MSLIPDDPIAEIRSRADIVEVISSYVVLKRSGRNFTGLCPFHQERTPSFNVNPQRQIFRCFGCGEGGDVFTFVMKAERQTFAEALKTLADKTGVVLPEKRPDADERAKVLEANELASEYYAWLLDHEDHGAQARAYLEARGIPAAWRKKFKLGLAPTGWDGLHAHLNGRQISPEIQVAAALVRTRQSGKGYYDYFRQRLMFPIVNESGGVVGFGARALEAGDEPKYLNSPDTLVYRKGNLLYGLNEARDSIKNKDRVLLVEGYMDVITAHVHGFSEAVGVLGTALTPHQARTLLRYSPSRRVILAFDADRAGLQAAERGIGTLSEVSQGVGLDLRVLRVPRGKDPDAYLRSAGSAEFTQLIDEAPVLFEFLLEQAISRFETQRPEGRAQAVTAAVPILRQIENYVSQDHYVGWLAEKIAVRPEAIRLEIGRGIRHNVAPVRGVAPSAKKFSGREAERLLLYYMVERPSVRALISSRLASIPFATEHQVIREAIHHLPEQLEEASAWPALLEKFQNDPPTQKIVSAISFENYNAWVNELEPVVEDCALTLEVEHWQKHKESLLQSIKGGEDISGAQTRRLQEILQYLIELDRRRRKLSAGTDEKAPRAGT
ncbi:MAG: DNA primase [Candidatus Sericytochromatia bacterium]|nr:DNA primase [Candidatus Sericytochromatia bacterium]